MKAEDLRIGNLVSVSYASFGFKVKKAKLGTIKSVQDYSKLGHDTFIKPIPLTEEWLVKFGVKWVIETGHGYIDGNYHFKAKKFKNGRIDIYINSSLANDNRIKHVHQLQNLYFALTGSEL